MADYDTVSLSVVSDSRRAVLQADPGVPAAPVFQVAADRREEAVLPEAGRMIVVIA